jgi:hypothetical protein
LNSLRNLLAVAAISIFCASAWAQSQFGQSPGARSAFKPNRSIDRNVLRRFPERYVYVNPSSLADAPPGRQIEFFVSKFGRDGLDVTGLTPGDAFATPQFCYDMVISRYYYDRIQPFCRIMNTTPGGSTTYFGPVEISGPSVTGAQNQGGTNIAFWGTCALDGSPWNSSVGGVAFDGSDTILQQGGPIIPTPTTIFSLVNGAIAQVSCVTVSADVFAFYSQQFSNLIINSNVRVINGPGGSTAASIAVDNHGQIYASGMVISASGAQFLVASNLGQVVFYSGAPGSIVFSGTPTFTNTLTLSVLSQVYLSAGASTFTGAVTATNKCSVTLNAVLVTGGTSASIPGTAACAAATGGQIN